MTGATTVLEAPARSTRWARCLQKSAISGSERSTAPRAPRKLRFLGMTKDGTPSFEPRSSSVASLPPAVSSRGGAARAARETVGPSLSSALRADCPRWLCHLTACVVRRNLRLLLGCGRRSASSERPSSSSARPASPASNGRGGAAAAHAQPLPVLPSGSLASNRLVKHRHCAATEIYIPERGQPQHGLTSSPASGETGARRPARGLGRLQHVACSLICQHRPVAHTSVSVGVDSASHPLGHPPRLFEESLVDGEPFAQ